MANSLLVGHVEGGPPAPAVPYTEPVVVTTFEAWGYRLGTDGTVESKLFTLDTAKDGGKLPDGWHDCPTKAAGGILASKPETEADFADQLPAVPDEAPRRRGRPPKQQAEPQEGDA